MKRIMQAARDLDIRMLTLYAFSAENWNRPPDEVKLLMGMLRGFLEQEGRELIRQEVRLQIAGDPSPLPSAVRQVLDKVMEDTRHFETYTLILALNYGSRQEILRAVQHLSREAQAGRVEPDQLTWGDLEQSLFTAGTPDPDLVIRTSGEYRLSNFLLLQSAYSEFVFSPVCWPDFDGAQLKTAVEEYRQRERRFGQTGEQIRSKSILPSLFKL